MLHYLDAVRLDCGSADGTGFRICWKSKRIITLNSDSVYALCFTFKYCMDFSVKVTTLKWMTNLSGKELHDRMRFSVAIKRG